MQMEDRIRALFPSVQITSVSIVVALTLENLLDVVNTTPAFWRIDATSITLWCHAVTVLAVTVKIWSGFAFNAIVLDRLPRATDVLGPLGLLLFVFALVACIAPGRETAWWTVMAAGTFFAAAYLWTQQPDETSMSRGPWSGAVQASTIEIGLGTAAATIAAFVAFGGLERATVLLLAAVYLVAQVVSAVGALRVWAIARAIIVQARGAATDAPPRNGRPPPAADLPDTADR